MSEELATQPRAASGRRLAIESAFVFGTALVLLLSLSRGLGLTWDESIYFRFADSVSDWFLQGADLSQEALDRAWAFNPVLNSHPELFRILDAIGAAATGRWLEFPLDYRFAHLLYMSICLAVVYRLLRPRVGILEAASALAFATMLPRSLGHLLLANSDSPVMITWLMAVVIAWRLEEEADPKKVRILRYALIAACSMAGAGKVTGVLLLPPLAVYFMVRRQRTNVLVVGIGALGALILPVLTSPEKWAHPVDEMVSYLFYPLLRRGIPIETTYLGLVYIHDLPWHYFIVMSLLTVPIPIWLCLPGLAMCPEKWRSLAQALALSVALWVCVGSVPFTPRHDGVRQFVSVYPLLALLGWIGSMGYRDRLLAEHPHVSKVGLSALGLVVPLILTGIVYRAHPHELSFYNSFAGGLRGAERMGMEITYYFDAMAGPTLRAIDENVRPGETLALSPLWADMLDSYRDHQRLRGGFHIVKAGDPADWLLLYRRRHTVDDKVYLSLPAVHEVQFEGVSLLKLVKQSDTPKELGYPKPTPRP